MISLVLDVRSVLLNVFLLEVKFFNKIDCVVCEPCCILVSRVVLESRFEGLMKSAMRLYSRPDSFDLVVYMYESPSLDETNLSRFCVLLFE